MQQIIAVGGGGYASQPDQIVLEEYILAQSNAARPKVCYLPQAGGEAKEYIVRFYEWCAKLGAQPSWLSLFGRVPGNWADHLLDQDVIYVGGGNTRSMLGLWREWGVDRALRQALAQGIVLSGVSAGAICWFQQGITDSSDQLSVLPCLGFLEGSCCPHYDSEADRKPATWELIATGQALPAYALEDAAAVHFVDGRLKQAITARSEGRAYHLTRENEQIVETVLPAVYLGGGAHSA